MVAVGYSLQLASWCSKQAGVLGIPRRLPVQLGHNEFRSSSLHDSAAGHPCAGKEAGGVEILPREFRYLPACVIWLLVCAAPCRWPPGAARRQGS